MTLQSDVADLFGLAATFPRPAWVVLDAARDHRFTGELAFDTSPPVRAWFDRGHIYLAETAGDPSLGARLVDAGALNPAELEHGAIRVGEAEDLGYVFDRVPSVDRQFVLVVTEMMNEACIGQLAAEQVSGVEHTPYRFHPSGVHRWHRGASETELRPGSPLPAPDPLDVPVETTPPASLFAAASNNTDTLIRWDQPSWLDELPPATPAPEATWIESDWVDRLTDDGLPIAGDDPLGSPAPLPAMRSVPTDRFEIIWPSGEIDEGFGDVDAVAGLDERDRVGPTARVRKQPAHQSAVDTDVVRDLEPEPVDLAGIHPTAAHDTLDRRNPETRAAEPAHDPTTQGTATERATVNIWAVHDEASSRSVFDDEAPALATVVSLPEATTGHTGISDGADTAEAPRTSALRRLIGGLRRR